MNAHYHIDISEILIYILNIILIVFGTGLVFHYIVEPYYPQVMHILFIAKDLIWIYSAIFAEINISDIKDPSVTEFGTRARSVKSDIRGTVIDIAITLICLVLICMYGF